ncbi:hypothetical protein BT63DRAFT_469517 [Microthyrium microscopicum]|uniref:Pheromone alpha factor receptor n=1 Tax=Microthyrium microscopicum TaxID=703497 RepID=A0A6A6UE78_9PEZI|nr:hypothetical protein BT63DRAFT_469517 [Microthyrium microscopicum]
MANQGGNMPGFTFPPPADPFSQVITILLPDGTPFNITMADFAEYHTYGVRFGISRGAAIGASVMLLIVLLLLTKPDKRRSPIFALNSIALLLNSIIALLTAIFLAGPWQNPYASLVNDYDNIKPIDLSNSLAVPVLRLLLLSIVFVSLILQVKVIAATMRRVHRLPLLGACVFFALVAIGVNFAFMVQNCRNIMTKQPFFTPSFARLQKAAWGTEVVTLFLFTLVFTAKLGVFIFRRRQLGVKKFGPMRAVFIMGLQTMILPTILASLQFDTALPEMGTWYHTLVVLLLPLSSLWAAATLNDKPRSQSSRPILGFGSSGVSRSGATTAPVSPSETTVNPFKDDPELGKMGLAGGYSRKLQQIILD